MVWFRDLNDDQILLIKFWLLPLVTGLVVWLLLLLLGDTPIVRSSGLAISIVGVTLALRRMGSVLASIGGLTLALSPAFWSQTGGGQGEPATIVIAIACAVVVVALTVVISKRPYLAFGIGLIIFAALFWSQIGTPRSLRLTGFIVAWLMYLLIDMLLLTNPRPDDAPMILRDGGLKLVDGAIPARAYHLYGILLLMTVGIINDPLLTILMPCVAISLLLTQTRLAWWYWIGMAVITIFGLRGLWINYLVEQAHLIDLLGWRDGTNWVTMIRIIITQFTIVGSALSILGLARLARWYPPLGTVSMVGFAAYWIFGTIYFGPNREILLLPMYVIFVLWMSYAVLALSEWAAKSIESQQVIGRYAVIFAYGLLPIYLLWQIIN